MTIDQGMFGFNQLMNEFYNYKPGSDDSEGRAQKNAFMANMIQSGFDAQMAKDMGQQQAAISQQNMTHAADLEMRNTLTNMEQEYNYGMASMGAQYDYQNQFANNQFNRDVSMVGIQGYENREQVAAEGAQDRLTETVKGEQQRENTKLVTQSQENIASTQAEATKYGKD